jgi:hypothetical protein
MYELYRNGRIMGVFSKSEYATEYADLLCFGTYSVFPLGTMISTDKNLKSLKNELNEQATIVTEEK